MSVIQKLQVNEILLKLLLIQSEEKTKNSRQCRKSSFADKNPHRPTHRCYKEQCKSMIRKKFPMQPKNYLCF